MIIFPFADHLSLFERLESTAARGRFQIDRFENGELYASLFTPVRMEHCVVLGSIAPPDERLLSLTLLAHTLKKEGCRKVTALLPYLAYSRQDKVKSGQSLAAAWIGFLLQASGADEACTIDVHSKRDQELFPIPLISSFPAELFAKAIRNFHLTDATVVAPDNGAIPRCQAVNEALGRPLAAISYFEKIRDETGVKHVSLFGNVGPRALIIDDMLDTGGTLVSASEKLIATGTREIFIIVTHGLFTGIGWKKLWSLNVQRIFCTDTIPAAKETMAESRITILPLGEMLREQLAQLQIVAGAR